jgi:hypothetical protein
MNYRCYIPGFEAFDISFESGGDTECTGKRVRPGYSETVRLKCDFSELCDTTSCHPAIATPATRLITAGFQYESTTCTEH